MQREKTVISSLSTYGKKRLWALQYALHVKVLTPQRLRDNIKEDLRKAMENYN